MILWATCYGYNLNFSNDPQINWLIQAHHGNKWCGQDLKLGLLIPNPVYSLSHHIGL